MFHCSGEAWHGYCFEWLASTCLSYLRLVSPPLYLQNYSAQGGTGNSGNGGGDEDYEIPPITPPNHPEPPLLHLMDPESSYLCHSLPHNGLINPYSYPELPALMMSNMLAQDGHLLSSQMPSVSLPGFLSLLRQPAACLTDWLNEWMNLSAHLQQPSHFP